MFSLNHSQSSHLRQNVQSNTWTFRSWCFVSAPDASLLALPRFPHVSRRGRQKSPWGFYNFTELVNLGQFPWSPQFLSPRLDASTSTSLFVHVLRMSSGLFSKDSSKKPCLKPPAWPRMARFSSPTKNFRSTDNRSPVEIVASSFPFKNCFMQPAFSSFCCKHRNSKGHPSSNLEVNDELTSKTCATEAAKRCWASTFRLWLKRSIALLTLWRSVLCIHSNSSREEENTSLGFVFLVLEKASFGWSVSWKRYAFFCLGGKGGPSR